MPMLTFEEYLEADRLLYANSGITEIPSDGPESPSSGGTPHHPDITTTDLEIIFKPRREGSRKNRSPLRRPESRKIPSTRRDFAPWPIPPTLARIVGILIVLGIVRAIAQVVGL